MRTRRAMDIVGISHEEQVSCICKALGMRQIDLFGYCIPGLYFDVLFQEAIFRTLAAILHLGNIEFAPGKEHDSSVIKDQNSNFHLQMAANLFMQVNLLRYLIFRCWSDLY